MLSVLAFRREGPVLHFVFATSGLESHEWHHTSLAEPTVEWVEDLLNLARTHHGAVPSTEVVRCIGHRATQRSLPLAGIDWLGLALYAAHRFREIAARLATVSTPELQERCREADVIRTACSNIYARVDRGIYEVLRPW